MNPRVPQQSHQSLHDGAGSAPHKSVHRECIEEENKHRWIESEKAGRDLGEAAISRWVGEYWHGFLRSRWVEHLEGKVFWVELDRGNFGLLEREFGDRRELVGQVVSQLKAGGENIDVLNWAIANHVPVEPVIAILETLDVASTRLAHRLQRDFQLDAGPGDASNPSRWSWQWGAPAEPPLRRAERLLVGLVRPGDALVPPAEVERFVEAEAIRLRADHGVEIGAEARQRLLANLTLRHYHAGELVARARAERGAVVLAAGEADVAELLRKFPYSLDRIVIEVP